MVNFKAEKCSIWKNEKVPGYGNCNQAYIVRYRQLQICFVHLKGLIISIQIYIFCIDNSSNGAQNCNILAQIVCLFDKSYLH